MRRRNSACECEVNKKPCTLTTQLSALITKLELPRTIDDGECIIVVCWYVLVLYVFRNYLLRSVGTVTRDGSRKIRREMAGGVFNFHTTLTIVETDVEIKGKDDKQKRN